MSKINVRVCKQVVLCSKCKNPKVTLFLSDFSYGQRLVTYDEGKQYAFLDLLEDEAFDPFKKMLKTVLEKHNKEIRDDYQFSDFLDKTLGITFDKIEGHEINFFEEKRKSCDFCSSVAFESLLAEPESVMNIEAALITHKNWMSLTEVEQEEKIEQELKRKKVL